MTIGTTSALPPLCYVRHHPTGEKSLIIRGENHYYPANTKCRAEHMKAKLPHPPSAAWIVAMKHGSLMGWDAPGADPAMWERAAAGAM